MSAPVARVVSKDQGPLSHSAFVRWLGLGLAALGVLNLMRGVLMTRLYTRLRAPGSDDIESTLASLRTLRQIFPPLLLVAGAFIIVMLYMTWARLEHHRLRTTALAALAVNVAAAAIDALFFAANLLESQAVFKFFYGNWPTTLAVILLMLAAPASILWFLHRRGTASNPWPLIGLALLGVGALYAAVTVISKSRAPSGLWVNFMLRDGTYVGAMLIAGALAWFQPGAAFNGSIHAMGITRGSAWAPAASGLRLYASALVWRLLLTVGGYLLLIMAIKGHSFGFVKSLSWALPFVGLVTGGIMTLGVFGYSNQPDGSRARPPAIFAGIMMAAALVIDLYIFVTIVRIVGLDANDGWEVIRDAQKSAESAQSMAVWGMALSLSAFVALLSSFHLLARDLGEDEIAQRAVGVGVFVVIASAVAVGTRVWLGGQRRIDDGTLLIAGFTILIALLVAVVAYLNLVGRLQHCLADEVLQLSNEPDGPDRIEPSFSSSMSSPTDKPNT